MGDPTQEQPERFKRAVRAACVTGDDDFCDYPNCPCGIFPAEVKAAIIAWYEMPPNSSEAKDR